MWLSRYASGQTEINRDINRDIDIKILLNPLAAKQKWPKGN